MSMTQKSWNNVIIECTNITNIKKVSDTCYKNRAKMIIVPNDCIEQSMVYRSIIKSNHVICTTIHRIDQRSPGYDKFVGLPAEVFEVDSFEIHPYNTDNYVHLLNDLRSCSQFLTTQISQNVSIGWNMCEHKLSDGNVVKLFDSMIYGYKPNYMRFNKDQEIVSNTAKKTFAAKIALPHNSELTSDFRIILDTEL